jgi:hypothetical protein
MAQRTFSILPSSRPLLLRRFVAQTKEPGSVPTGAGNGERDLPMPLRQSRRKSRRRKETHAAHTAAGISHRGACTDCQSTNEAMSGALLGRFSSHSKLVLTNWASPSSTAITRLQRHNEPLCHPRVPGPSSRASASAEMTSPSMMKFSTARRAISPATTGKRNRVFPPVQKMPSIHASLGASRDPRHHDFAVQKLD